MLAGQHPEPRPGMAVHGLEGPTLELRVSAELTRPQGQTPAGGRRREASWRTELCHWLPATPTVAPAARPGVRGSEPPEGACLARCPPPHPEPTKTDLWCRARTKPSHGQAGPQTKAGQQGGGGCAACKKPPAVSRPRSTAHCHCQSRPSHGGPGPLQQPQPDS